MKKNTPAIAESVAVAHCLRDIFLERLDYTVFIGQSAPGVLKVYGLRKNQDALQAFLDAEYPKGFMGHTLVHDKV